MLFASRIRNSFIRVAGKRSAARAIKAMWEKQPLGCIYRRPCIGSLPCPKWMVPSLEFYHYSVFKEPEDGAGDFGFLALCEQAQQVGDWHSKPFHTCTFWQLDGAVYICNVGYIHYTIYIICFPPSKQLCCTCPFEDHIWSFTPGFRRQVLSWRLDIYWEQCYDSRRFQKFLKFESFLFRQLLSTCFLQ